MTWHDGQIPKKGDLKLRLLSASILIPFGLYVVWSGGLILAVSCAVFGLIMTYEWVRMTRSPSMRSLLSLVVLPVLFTHGCGLQAGLIALCLCAVTAALVHPLGPRRGAQAFGLIYTAGFPMALYQLRMGDWDGMTAALLIMGLVWVSDSLAYFSGRAIGGPSLHPDSPSKTWSGAIGAVVFCMSLGAAISIYLSLDLIIWLVAGAVISILAQLGDMLESSVKRTYNIKDSSHLVPGHGGIMDRVDGLGFVCFIIVPVFHFFPQIVALLGLAA